MLKIQKKNLSSTQKQSLPATQRRPGRAKGSQGYSVADCVSLVDGVKAFLPLGAQEWGYVLDQYNNYATENNWVIRNLDPLKIKLCALATHSKPTGDPDCPLHIRDAKATLKAMDSRVH